MIWHFLCHFLTISFMHNLPLISICLLLNQDMFQKIQSDSDLRVKLFAKLNPSSELKNVKAGPGKFTHK